MLVVDTNSWHYHYYSALRRYFGVDTADNKTTSLCPYVQTMIWGSILLVLTIPLQALGWLSIKLCRLVYKACESTGLTGVVDWVDNTQMGKSLAKSSDDLMENPFLTTISWCVGAFLAVCMLFAFAFVLVMILVHGILAIPYIPWLIWKGMTYAGWGLVWAAWVIAMAVYSVCYAVCVTVASVFWSIVWLFTTAWIWLLILQIIGWAIIIVCGCFLAGLLIMWITRSPVFAWLRGFLAMKLNGYQAARETAAQRRILQAEQETPRPPRENWWTKRVVPFFAGCCNGIAAFFGAIRDFFVSRNITVAGTTNRVLSPMAALWTFGWAVKKQMCPLVQFVDARELARQQEEQAQQEGKKPQLSEKETFPEDFAAT